jgi:hypothetical protein
MAIATSTSAANPTSPAFIAWDLLSSRFLFNGRGLHKRTLAGTERRKLQSGRAGPAVITMPWTARNPPFASRSRCNRSPLRYSPPARVRCTLA